MEQKITELQNEQIAATLKDTEDKGNVVSGNIPFLLGTIYTSLIDSQQKQQK